MPSHPSRFPGLTNEPKTLTLTKRRATRLKTLTGLGVIEHVDKPVVSLGAILGPRIDPHLLLFRKICGQVVKLDADGEELPVPFASVTVYDTDIRLLAWSPAGWPYSWFFPYGWTREKLATVTTDECGRFCVWVPQFDIDFMLRWRLERRCYLEWLRRPTVADLLEPPGPEINPRPQPDPAPVRTPVLRTPLRIDARVLRRAEHVLDDRAAVRLRGAAPARIGERVERADATLSRLAFPETVHPPLTGAALEMFEPAMRSRLASRVGLTARELARFDRKRVFGPFLRCRTVIVPEWTAIRDVPDLTFEVTQDINGDGVQEVIYREGLFDVRWNAGALPEIKLQADASAIAGPSCDIPDVGACGEPAILFAGNYPLQVPSNASDYHDASTGYALLPNRPDGNGVPGGNDRVDPAQTPMAGSFFLVGCAERPGATHYRVHHEVDGVSKFVNRSFGPLMRVIGGALQQRVVSPEGGQWYPIIARADGWTPAGILARIVEGGNNRHVFRLEFGQAHAGGISPIANSLTEPVAVHIDATRPTVTPQLFRWRHPDGPGGWNELPIDDCAVVRRVGARRVQIHLRFSVTANHLRSMSVTAQGCGPAAVPELITDGRDGLPTYSALDSQRLAHYWHRTPGDNSLTRDLYYELPANADAGCYTFSLWAGSRAFHPTMVPSGDSGDPVIDWKQEDPAPIWVKPVMRFALQ